MEDCLTKVQITSAAGLLGGHLFQEFQQHAYAPAIMHFQATLWGKRERWGHPTPVRRLRPSAPPISTRLLVFAMIFS